MSKLMCSIANVRQVEMLFSDGRGGTDNMKPIPRKHITVTLPLISSK